MECLQNDNLSFAELRCEVTFPEITATFIFAAQEVLAEVWQHRSAQGALLAVQVFQKCWKLLEKFGKHWIACHQILYHVRQNSNIFQYFPAWKFQDGAGTGRKCLETALSFMGGNIDFPAASMSFLGFPNRHLAPPVLQTTA
jgi:hypothetical protein